MPRNVRMEVVHQSKKELFLIVAFDFVSTSTFCRQHGVEIEVDKNWLLPFVDFDAGEDKA